MSFGSGLGRQLGDLVTFILLPLLCVVLPYSTGQALIRAVAGRGLLLKARSGQALQTARRFVDIADGENWKARWRSVELSDARDLWFGLLGRRKGLVNSVRVEGLPAAADRQVLVGSHWGTGLRALMVFRRHGLHPRFVYRTVGRDILSAAPFNYVYLKLLVRCIGSVCEGRQIEVPGGRRNFEAALAEAGTPVILLDAPALHEAHSMRAEVLGREALFNRNGARLLADHGARCVFYALGEEGQGESVLRCRDSFEPASAEELMAEYGGFLSSLLQQDSAQWRLWHAAGQLFNEAR